MTKVVVHASVWNSAQFIASAILPIQKYVDEIFVFDGAYGHMKKFTTVPWSTDGTEQIVKALKLNCTLIWVPCKDFFEDEIAKRTFMMKYLNEDEWMYLLSDDEIATMNVQTAFQRIRSENQAVMGHVPMIEFPRGKEFRMEVPNGPLNPYEMTLERQLRAVKGTGGKDFLKPRFFKGGEGIHWRGGLSDVYNGKGERWEIWPYIVLDEMLLWHVKWLRNETRHKMQLDYEGIPF